jgi:twitching motility protein PilT
MTPKDRLFGELAIKAGLVTRLQVSQLLSDTPSASLRDLLTQSSVLTPQQIQSLDRQCDKLLSTASPAPTETKPVAASSPKSDGQSPATSAEPYLHKVLQYALSKGASDVHVHGDAPLLARIQGKLAPLRGETPIGSADSTKVVLQILRPEQVTALEATGQLDFAYEVNKLGRFRVNVYKSFRGTDAVFRLIPPHIRTVEELGLPPLIKSFTDFRTGIVLCTGPTGCGKSTTLAALVQHLNATRQDHVITLENPVEHVYPKGLSHINQREVITHTTSFGRALRAALREDPDIIAITELRDRDSMSLALSAAETGHLVLGTLHTSSAAQTISRVINAFPGGEQEHIRAQLSESLRAVVSQRLVPRADGTGLIPAVEILVVNTAVANIIREDKVFQLPSVMQTGKALGMVSLDESLLQLVQSGVVAKADARALAVQKERFN